MKFILDFLINLMNNVFKFIFLLIWSINDRLAFILRVRDMQMNVNSFEGEFLWKMNFNKGELLYLDIRR